jgi:selenocysteine lyase/cysteine desulfurase
MSPLFGALKSSIDLVNSWQVSETLQHVHRLHDIIIETLDGHSQFSVVSNLESQYRSGILTIRHGDSESIVNKLHEENMIVAFRDGNIRIAPHGYNTEEEVERFATRLTEFD